MRAVLSSATLLFEKLSTQEQSLLGALDAIERRVHSDSAAQAALAETCHRLDTGARLHLQQLRDRDERTVRVAAEVADAALPIGAPRALHTLH